ncbi:MAG: hypothetical protein Q4G28_02115 [Neisseria sp.]|nr:hypothetical protein [Neisseria sp.]
MAHANPYTPGQVETLEEARAELVKLADTVNTILENQQKLQRDDGCLKDCSVVPHTLSDEVMRMIGDYVMKGEYAAMPYQKGQVVSYRQRLYVCIEPHDGGDVMDMKKFKLIGKAGCGCDGGGEAVSNPCAAKSTYAGVLDQQNQRIDTSNGCLVFMDIKHTAISVWKRENGNYDYRLDLDVDLKEGEEITIAIKGGVLIDDLPYLRFDSSFYVYFGNFEQHVVYNYDPMVTLRDPFGLFINAWRINGVNHYLVSLNQAAGVM